ncbi:TonB-dependent receptor [Sphingorhabdus sp.]|jgi:iron complex outermembrane receptor protein|uniref:TonB-dependent receptor n=1 Tax=Sphingorhabdus sp. TaxID=1902408 RepID=UPI0037CB582B
MSILLKRKVACCTIGHALVSLGVFGLLNISSTALAQDALPPSASSDPDSGQEILVSARRRDERLQDVGITATVIGGEALSKLNLVNSADLVLAVPGLTNNATAGRTGKANYNLRGVGLQNFSNLNEAAVALYKDEIYIASLTGSQTSFFDLERIEVLKGPQGTLFGRSASGGLVHLISRKPKLSETEGYAEASYGSYDYLKLGGAVNVPLGEKVAIRASGHYQRNDGWIKNLLGPDQAQEKELAARIQVRVASGDLDSVLKYEFGKSGTPNANAFLWYPIGLVGGVAVRDNNADISGYFDSDGKFFTGSFGIPGLTDAKTHLLQNQITLALSDSLSLLALTGYSTTKWAYREDLNAGPLFNESRSSFKSRQFVQELRLSSSGAGPLNWSAGIFYFNWRVLDNSNDIILYRPSGVSAFGIDSRQGKDSVAGYADLTFQVSEKFSLNAGVRLEHEDVNFRHFIGGSSPAANRSPKLLVFSASSVGSTYLSGGAGAEYKPTPDVLMYATAKRGIKPGGFNAPFGNTVAAEYPYKEERLDAFEFGLKSEFLENTVIANAAVWYYNYQDYQSNERREFAFVVSNADAKLSGVDFDLTARPAPGLRAGVAGSFLFKRTAAVVLDLAIGAVDRIVPNAPKRSLVGFAEYGFPVAGGDLVLRADVNNQSATFFDIQNNPAFLGADRTVANFRADWTKEGFQVGAFLQNAFNERYALNLGGNAANGWGKIVPGKPRWAGIQMALKW